jgi:hypothetical protein
MFTTKTLILTLSGMACLFALDAEEGKGKKRRGDHHKGGHFQHLDKNGDGFVSKVEFLDQFNAMDLNGDAMISESEQEEFREKRKEEMKNMTPEDRFAKMDQDGSGAIESNEFRGPKELFTKMDSNGDGQVTLEEAKAMKGKRKGKGKGRQGEGEENAEF